MARDSQAPLSGPSTTWLALLIGAAGLFAVTKVQFQDTRPAAAAIPTYTHIPSEPQDVEARLWEDPLSAVALERGGERPKHTDAAHPIERLLQSMNRGSGAHILVIGVFVTGAPYPEAIESRRRMRYAVLAGLHREGFAPENAEHIGYFPAQSTLFGAKAADTAKETDEKDADSAVAYEWMVADDAIPQSPEISHRDAHDSALVLWIDQDAVGKQPLENFTSWVDAIDPTVRCSDPKQVQECAGFKDVKTHPTITSVIIGPDDSDGLVTMTQELSECTGDAQECAKRTANRRPVSIYPARVTAADRGVDQSRHCLTPDPTLVESAPVDPLKANSGGRVSLHRVVANDCTVTSKLYDALLQRGVRSPNEIALVVERDTVYARLMSQYFGGCRTVPTTDLQRPLREAHPACFTYLRGLDGLTPPPVGGHEPSSSKGSSGKKDETSGSSNTPTSTDGASGPSQLDYLRRLATQITVASSECAATDSAPGGCGGRGIRAIGVLGTDVYDKILILQALRGQYPRAIFFTTDLDARLLDPQNLQWTRHLIVGSGFGLTLHPKLQGDIPPFRDTYQTSMYLSTLLAVSRCLPARQVDSIYSACTEDDPKAGGAPLAPPWVQQPRIFEIGRSDAFDSTRSEVGPNATCNTVQDCQDIFPHSPRAFWDTQSYRIAFELAFSLAMVLVVAVWIAGGSLAGRFGIVVASCAVVLIGGLTVGWPYLVQSIHEVAPGQPSVPIFSGASMCLAWSVEFLAITAVVMLVWRGKRMLDRNSDDIHEELCLPDTPAKLTAAHLEKVRKSHWTVRVGEWLWLPIGIKPLCCLSPTNPTKDIPIETLLGRFLSLGTGGKRTFRVSAATFVWTLFLLPVNWLLGTVFIDAGDLTDTNGAVGEVSKLLSVASCLAIQFLVFWIVDAMLLSRAFTLDLTRCRLEWPPSARAAAMRKLAMPATPTDAWLRLRLVAVRTECVAQLVWYPSIVLAAMGIAAFTVEFGQFHFASSPVALVLSAGVVVGSAVLLRRSAESLRTQAIELLENARSRALRTQSAGSTEGSQLDHLIERVTDLSEGAFAPYSQQPLVRALIVPAASYGASLLLQTYHLSAP